MKEFEEKDAIEAMAAVLPEELRNEDALLEILDLIYNYYEENGELEVDLDDDDEDEDETDIDGMVDFICRYVRKNSAAKDFTREDIVKAVQAEIEYEFSLTRAQ